MEIGLESDWNGSGFPKGISMFPHQQVTQIPQAVKSKSQLIFTGDPLTGVWTSPVTTPQFIRSKLHSPRVIRHQKVGLKKISELWVTVE